MPRVHHSRLGTRQAGDIRRIAIFLLGINPPVACQMKKEKRKGESRRDRKGFISHAQQGFLKQPGGQQASLKSAIWVACCKEL